MIKKLMLIGFFSTQALGMESQTVEPALKRMKDDTAALNEDLLSAASSSSPQRCADLIMRGANVHSVNASGDTPLHLVAKNYNYTGDLIRVLTEGGADVNALNIQGKTPLQIALESKRFYNMLALVNCGANIPPADGEGNTVLHLVARELWDGVPLIEALIARGISVHDLNNDQDSPLHVACASAGGNGLALTLIMRGANVHSVNASGDTPLHLVVKNYNDRGYLIRVLTEAGADVNARNIQGKTPLQIALESKRFNNMLALVNCGANIPPGDEEGNTVLHLVVRGSLLVHHNDPVPLIEALIARGISVHDLNNDQDSPLHVACAAGNGQLALALIARGAQVHSVNVGGDTPLHLAVCRGLVEVSRSLLARGANPIALNSYGDTPLTLASKFKSKAYQSSNAIVCLMCIQYATQTTGHDKEGQFDLLQRIQHITTDKEVLSCALRGALEMNNLNYAQALLVAGAALPAKAFIDAAKAHRSDQCVFLFRNGVSPWERVRLSSKLYTTPLHMIIARKATNSFFQEIWKTSPKININLGNEIVDLPERFLELFPLIAQRVRERSSDKDLISVPEFTPIWHTIRLISYLLFVYSIIDKLQEKDQDPFSIEPKRREEVEMLFRNLENQLFNRLSHCAVADISTLREVLKSLGAPILVPAVESVLQKMEGPLLQTLLDDRPVIDTNDVMRIQCNDDESVLLVPKAYCTVSMTLKNIAEDIDDSENDYIPLPNISSATWKLIDGQRETLYALALIKENELISAQAKKAAMTPYLDTLMSAYKGLSLPELAALIQAANFLDIQPLLDITLEICARRCSVIAVQEALPGTQVTFENVLLQVVSIKRQYKSRKLLEPFLRQVTGDARRLMIEKLHPEVKKIALQWMKDEQKKR